MKKKPEQRKRPEQPTLYDDMDHIVSSNDMTGLMAAPAQDDEEKQNYNEMLTYTPKKSQ